MFSTFSWEVGDGGEIKKEREVLLRKEFALFVLESP